MFDDMMRYGERFWSSGNSAEVVEWIAAPNSQGIGQHTRQPKRAVCGENKHPFCLFLIVDCACTSFGIGTM